VRIKWPNDVYFGRQVKLGGIIVKSSVMSDVIHVNIGRLSVCLSVCLSVSLCLCVCQKAENGVVNYNPSHV